MQKSSAFFLDNKKHKYIFVLSSKKDDQLLSQEVRTDMNIQVSGSRIYRGGDRMNARANESQQTFHFLGYKELETICRKGETSLHLNADVGVSQLNSSISPRSEYCRCIITETAGLKPCLTIQDCCEGWWRVGCQLAFVNSEVN